MQQSNNQQQTCKAELKPSYKEGRDHSPHETSNDAATHTFANFLNASNAA
jgi:hypothetical protein